MRFRLFLVVISVAVLGYSALWYISAERLKRNLEASKGAFSDGGLALEWEELAIKGFPYRLEVHVKKSRIGNDRRTANLRAEQLIAVTHLWTPGHWVFEAVNAQATLPFIGEVSDDSIIASIRRHRGGNRGVFIGSGNDGDFNWGGERLPREWSLSFGIPGPNQGDEDGGLYDSPVLLFAVKLGGGGHRLALGGNITGALPKNWTRPALAEWRDAGGLINFDQISYQYEKAALSGNGSLALDDRLAPLGTLALTERQDGDLNSLFDQLGLPKPDAPQATLLMQNGRLSVDAIPAVPLSPVVR